MARVSIRAVAERSGPLQGVKIIELAGIGPGPFTCMMLADAGAEVLRLERAAPGAVERGEAQAASGAGAHWDFLNRSRPSVGIDLKNPDALELVLGLVERADGLVEGFRPGVAERLGLGPDVCLARNPKLVYGRMTGWGQDGPMASHGRPRHRLHRPRRRARGPMGRADSAPVPPLNLVGDFGGGGMLLAFGMVAALFEAQRSGRGQVVDAAMVDGAASLMTMIHAFHAAGSGTTPGHQHARHGRALLRGLRDVGRAVDGGRRYRAAVLRGAAPGLGLAERRGAARPDDDGTTGRP